MKGIRVEQYGGPETLRLRDLELPDPGPGKVRVKLRAAGLKAGNVVTLRRRLERAVNEGELSERVDCQAVASFYTTVQQGMAIQARDGASRKTLLAIADSAMAAWKGLTAR